MKGHVEIGHLTKYDAFRVNRDQVMDLEIWLKIHTNVSNINILRQRWRPPKPYKLLKFSICKIPLCTYYLKEAEMKISIFAHFKEYHGNHKKLRVYMVLGDAVSKIRDICVKFQTYFKVHNLVSVHPKSIILGQMTNLNMIFHVVVSVYRLIKI